MRKYLVISGPSAAGKSTVLKELARRPDVQISVSYTTRPRRAHEVDGADYHFVTREEFEQKLAGGFFLEHTLFSGNYYGTPAAQTDTGKLVVFDVDLPGYRYFRRHHLGDAYFCLLIADIETIEQRLRSRAAAQGSVIPESDWKARLSTAEVFRQFVAEGSFDRVIDNSRPLEETLRDVDSMLLEIRAAYS